MSCLGVFTYPHYIAFPKVDWFLSHKFIWFVLFCYLNYASKCKYANITHIVACYKNEFQGHLRCKDLCQNSSQMTLFKVQFQSYQSLLYTLEKILLKKVNEGTYLTWIIHLVTLRFYFCLGDGEHWFVHAIA